jgi:hypothetical protein
MINQIEQTVKKLSEEIWTDIKAASDYKLSFGEESITDKVLLELARLNSSSIKIIPFGKKEESKYGPDFFWIIGTGNKWTSFLIQAKKITHKDQKYNALNYKGKKSEKTQLELLDDFSIKTGILACYCFYNSEYEGIGHNDILCTQCKSNTRIDINILGWTITSIDNIKKLKKQAEKLDPKKKTFKFKEVHEKNYETIPLSCLFHKLGDDILNKNQVSQKATDSPEISDLPWYKKLIYTETAQSHYDKIMAEIKAKDKNKSKNLPKSIVFMDMGGYDVHLNLTE